MWLINKGKELNLDFIFKIWENTPRRLGGTPLKRGTNYDFLRNHNIKRVNTQIKIGNKLDQIQYKTQAWNSSPLESPPAVQRAGGGEIAAGCVNPTISNLHSSKPTTP